MRSIAIALVTVSTMLAASAASEPEPAMTAQDLQQLCSGEDHVSKNACRIYILGVTQGIAVGVQLAGAKNARGTPCIPAGTSADALEQTIKTRLGEDLASRPADASLGASGFIGSALVAAYPCTKHPS
jgi:Rap1a immunity proteins